MNKQNEIIDRIKKQKEILEKTINFYEKNKNNESIKHFWHNITIELDDVYDEIRRIQWKIVELGENNE